MQKKPKFKQKNRLRLHEDVVIGLYSPSGVYGNILYSCSKDGLVYIVDFADKKVMNSVTMLKSGPQMEEKQLDVINEQGELKKIAFDNLDKKPVQIAINSVLFHDNVMYGGYHDGDIFGWNIKSGEVLFALLGHTKVVNKIVTLNERVIVSASSDKTIRTWDTTSGLGEQVLQVDGIVTEMQVYNKDLYALISHNQISSFTNDKLMHLKSFYFENTVITTFLIHEDKYYIANNKNEIQIMEIIEVEKEEGLKFEQFETKQVFKNHSDWVLTMKIWDKYLFSGSDDKSIKVFDLELNKMVDEFTDHNDGVVSLEFCDNSLYSGSFDHLIRYWNLDEMKQRILDRKLMAHEDIESKKYEVYYKLMFKKKGKKGGKKKKK